MPKLFDSYAPTQDQLLLWYLYQQRQPVSNIIRDVLSDKSYALEKLVNFSDRGYSRGATVKCCVRDEVH